MRRMGEQEAPVGLAAGTAQRRIERRLGAHAAGAGEAARKWSNEVAGPISFAPRRIDVPKPAAGLDAADPRHRCLGAAGRGGDGFATVGSGGEDELVVVAAGEQAFALQRFALAGEIGAARQGVDLDHRADAGAPQHVAEIAGQAIGNVDGAAGDADERPAEGDPGRRLLHRPANPRERIAGHGDRAAQHLEREAGVAERAADPEIVAGARARAKQRRPARDLAEGRDRDRQRAARGVAADQLAVVPLGQRQQAAGEGREERLVGRGQGQRQREGERPGAACGQVAQVHRQRLVPQALGRDGRDEVPALDQHVARDRERHARCDREQGAVVADAERGTAHRLREVAGDEFELAEQGHGRRGS